MTVDLNAGTASGGDAQGDALSNIENLTGSGYADTLTGDSGANVLSGGAGNDILTGGAGDDTLTGGDGDDTFIYALGDGDDTISGGTSDVDVLNLAGVGVLGQDWTMVLNVGTIEGQTADQIDLSNDAAGTITLSDGAVITFDGLEQINVNPGIPVGVNSLASMEQNTPITGQLSAVDPDNLAGELTYSLVSGPANGSVVINADGSYTLAPDAGFDGADSFTFQVADPDGNISTATVSIDVLAKTVDMSSGSEFQVSTQTTGHQHDSSVTVLADGSYVIVWESNDGQDGSFAGVFGQRFDANDNPIGSEFQVNTFTSGSQDNPKVVALDNGGFVVVWESDGQDGDLNGIHGQRYDANGNTVGAEFGVNTTTTGAQEDVSISALSDGGFVVVWAGNGAGDAQGIFGQRYDANGNQAGSEFGINSTVSDSQDNAEVAALEGGGFVVVWSGPDGSGYGVSGQRYDANGNTVGGEFQVNTTTTDYQDTAQITALSDGGFVVVWESYLQDGSSNGTYGQRYDANGNAVNSEFQINTTTAGDQGDPSIGALADGGFLVVWESSNQDGSGRGIYAQQYDSNGNTVGSETLVNTYTTNDQHAPTIALTSDGGVIVAWTSEGQDGSSGGIYAHHYAGISSGSHPMTGGTGNDSFIGGDQGGTISGGAGNDILEGAAGADNLDGGAGVDTASYASSDQGVTVDLNAGTASGSPNRPDRRAPSICSRRSPCPRCPRRKRARVKAQRQWCLQPPPGVRTPTPEDRPRGRQSSPIPRRTPLPRDPNRSRLGRNSRQFLGRSRFERRPQPRDPGRSRPGRRPRQFPGLPRSLRLLRMPQLLPFRSSCPPTPSHQLSLPQVTLLRQRSGQQTGPRHSPR